MAGHPDPTMKEDKSEASRPHCHFSFQARLPGGIPPAHDIHAGTIDAMPSTLEQLPGMGFRFVAVTQLLAMGTSGDARRQDSKQGDLRQRGRGRETSSSSSQISRRSYDTRPR